MSKGLMERSRLLRFELSDGQLGTFERYADLLLSSEKRAGVTALRTRERIEQRHFVESLTLARALLDRGILDEATPSRVMDVGTGAGLPGLPLKILLPQLRLTLLDARQRTTAFLAGLLEALAITDVEIVTARAEDAGRDPSYREQFDMVLARALAPLPVLLELTMPFLRVGGYLGAPKGSGALREIDAARRALELLGGVVVSSESLNAPGGLATQRLVIVEKDAPTPSRYPRRAGIPTKRPL
jgi:16S rRNA (guanine527-N7)-methyltransferase